MSDSSQTTAAEQSAATAPGAGAAPTEGTALAEGAEVSPRAAAKTRPGARTLSGAVVSDRMDKTITVRVERSVKHPVYGKILRRRSKIHAHDEHNECRVGDLVTIVETRPISKIKSWRLQSLDVKATSGDPDVESEAPATEETA